MPDTEHSLAASIAAERNPYVVLTFMVLAAAGVVMATVFQIGGHPARAAAALGLGAVFFAVGISTRRRRRPVTGRGRR